MKAHHSNQGKAASVIDHKKPQDEDKLPLDEKPSPMDFEAFVPWVCMAWETPVNVTITKLYQEEFNKSESRKASSKSAKSLKGRPEDDADNVTTKSAHKSTTAKASTYTYDSCSEDLNSVPIKAYYDSRGHLVEIVIIGGTIPIHRNIIRALSLCTNFHPLLSKLTIRRGLTAIILYEISKLLPHSNLTDVSLDDSRVPEENYYMLLDHISQLKTLSLNRCCLSDAACVNIAERLDFGRARCSLLTLDLGSNLISNISAHALGTALRSNRNLLHLGLSGNTITDEGAFSILRHLTEFPLTFEEIVNSRERKLKYLQDSLALYEKCLEELLIRQRIEMEVASGSGRKSVTSRNKSVKKLKKSPTALISGESNNSLAEGMVKEIIGKFADPFSLDNIIVRNEYCYGMGNMVLCSLNLAFNNLGYPSVKRICEVVRYQANKNKPRGASGLMRVVLDGNYVPESCLDYEKIDMFLRDSALRHYPGLSSLSLHSKKKRSSMSKKVIYSPTEQ